MPISVERLPDEPIIIATYSGHITINDIKTMYQTTADLMGDEQVTFHRISDVRGATSDFMEMLKTVQSSTQEMRGSSSDKRIHVTYVGTSTWIRFTSQAFASRGIVSSAFEDMETALESVRLSIASERNQQK